MAHILVWLWAKEAKQMADDYGQGKNSCMYIFYGEWRALYLDAINTYGCEGLQIFFTIYIISNIKARRVPGAFHANEIN